MNVTIFHMPEFLQHIQKSAKSSIKLTLTKEAATVTDSKVGGKPWLPPEMLYPQDEDRNDYLFIAQINWVQMPRLDGYPASGLTSFFVKEDDTFGLMDQSFQVLHFEEVMDTQEIDPFQPEDPGVYSPVLGGPYKLTGKLESQYVPHRDPQAVNFQLPTDEDNQVAYSKYWDLADASGSRIGGYPYFTQAYLDQDGWELLLQLDMEGDNYDYYVSWGDSGVGNFFIRREDLLRRDFSKVLYTWDCL
ncbi:YwqG family protein [Brevibacillus fortis]|uniref:YwqG family protein n=1 Tax=Brevibacillus fortis TaxID=2126352 RepID=UPI0038FC6842